jgi:hypothetical protein
MKDVALYEGILTKLNSYFSDLYFIFYDFFKPHEWTSITIGGLASSCSEHGELQARRVCSREEPG